MPIDYKAEFQDVEILQRQSDYLINNTAYPRVSSILSVINKPALVNWASKVTAEAMAEGLLKNNPLLLAAPATGELSDELKNQVWRAWVEAAVVDGKAAPNNKRESTANYGKESHSAIEAYIETGDYPEQNTVEYETVRAFEAWQEHSGIDIQLAETVVWSPLGYAGTIDGIGRTRDGQLAVVDLKTGGVYREAALQVGAYAYGLMNVTDEEVREAWVLRIPREPAPNQKAFQAYQVDIDRAFGCFAHALGLHKSLNQTLMREV